MEVQLAKRMGDSTASLAAIASASWRMAMRLPGDRWEARSKGGRDSTSAAADPDGVAGGTGGAGVPGEAIATVGTVPAWNWYSGVSRTMPFDSLAMAKTPPAMRATAITSRRMINAAAFGS